MKSCFLALVWSVVLSACNDSIKEKSSSSILSRDIDKIRLTDLNGKAISINQYAGKAIFINFWATWCKPCVEEMPSIQEAQKLLQSEKIIFLMASNESAEEIIEFSTARGYKFNYVRIENSEEMNVQSLPTTYIFNANGERVFGESGSRKWNEKNNIDTILKIVKQ